VTAAQIILGLVCVQRLIELAVARRNTERLLAQGAVEYGAGHYPWIVLFHGVWLAAIIFRAIPDAPVNWVWLAAFLGLQALRLWVQLTLGRFWTTRVISLAGVPVVQRGPYRLMRHPNYAVIIGEIAVLPLVFGEWMIAVAFSIVHALLLRERIRVEDEALAPRRATTSADS
jgi:methyltransferase